MGHIRGTLLVIFISLIGLCGGYSTHACYGGFFTDELCPSPSVINVTGANYGVSDCRGGPSEACCPKTTDCQIPVIGDNMQTIITKCNGKQQCTSLQATWSPALDCKVTGQSDYVTIHYDCLQGGSTVPSTLGTTSTGVTSSPGVTPTSDGSTTTEGPVSKGLSAGAIAGIVIGVILFILLVLFIIFAIIVRRKNPNWPQTHNWSDPFTDFKSYVPDRVTSVINRVKGKRDDIPAGATPTEYKTSLAHPAPRPYEDPELQPHLQHYSPPPRPTSDGVQIVRTPKEAIDGSAADTVIGSGLPPVGDEVVYEIIDDFSRDGSLRRAESYDSFDSVGLESGGVGNGSVIGAGVRGGNSGPVCLEDNAMYDRSSKMANNDVVYYDALQGNIAPGVQMQVENDAYDRSPAEDSHKGPGAMQPNNTKPETPRITTPSVRPQGSPDMRKGPKVSAKPNETKKSPGAQKPKPPPTSAKPGRTPPGAGVVDDQVYENSDLGPDQDEDNYYNAGPPSRGEERYSKLDPVTSKDPKGSKVNAYATLNRQNSTSC